MAEKRKIQMANGQQAKEMKKLTQTQKRAGEEKVEGMKDKSQRESQKEKKTAKAMGRHGMRAFKRNSKIPKKHRPTH